MKKVVSPFFGGGSIVIAMSKVLGLNVVGYDIFDILCNYWDFQIKKPEILFKKLSKLKPTFSEFERIRKILNKLTFLSRINNNLRRNKQKILFSVNKLIKKIENVYFIINSLYFLYK